MANNRMNGNVLGLEINGEFVSCETSCELSFETDFISASPVDEGRWKSSIAGQRSWSVNVNANMLLRMSGTGLPTILNAFITGERMYVRIRTKYDTEMPSFVIAGYVKLKNGGFSAAVNTGATWNAVLEGDGAMTYEINTNVVNAISVNLDNTQLLQNGNEALIVSTNNE